jgi:16S rRNA (uracil1498-N3)-methyltransferase
MSERFYINCSLQVGPVALEGAEAHHLASVCRLRPGDAVCLFNGDGHEYAAQVVSVQRRHVELDVTSQATPMRELPFQLEVAAPLPKGDRAQFLVEKLTELGVTTFVPLATARSVVHPRETKLERLQRQVIEASKQCGRNVLMRVEALADWAQYCRGDNLPRMRYFGQPGGAACMAGPEMLGANNAVAWAVGPEGGFDDSEVRLALDSGWKGIDLGARTLRVETAALVVPARLIPTFGSQLDGHGGRIH